MRWGDKEPTNENPSEIQADSKRNTSAGVEDLSPTESFTVVPSVVAVQACTIYAGASMFGIGRNANATFKPAKRAPAGSRRFELHKHAEATLGAGNLCQAVKCPTGENLNDWQAHAAQTPQPQPQPPHPASAHPKLQPQPRSKLMR